MREELYPCGGPELIHKPERCRTADYILVHVGIYTMRVGVRLKPYAVRERAEQRKG